MERDALLSRSPLHRGDKMISRKFIEKRLMETTEKDLPHIFIPSYKRPDFDFGKKVLPNFSKKAQQKVFVFVREKQIDRYYKHNKSLQYVVIPKGEVSGVGSTRQWLLDYAIKNRIPVMMDMDDDIIRFHYQFSDYTKSGKLTGRHRGELMNGENSYQLILQLAGRISREIFKKYPEVIVGNLRKQRFCHHHRYVLTKYQINKGPTPRQTKIINVKAVYKNDIVVPEAFNLHGDDIGFAAEVLQRGFSCFNIPCLTYDYVDDATNSVVRDIRNPESEANRRLHKLEYDALQQMEIKHYLRESFKFDDGQYKFGDIDWQKYHKFHGTEPITRYWRKDSER